MKILFLAAADSIHSHRWVRFFAEKGHEVHWVSLVPFDAPGEHYCLRHVWQEQMDGLIASHSCRPPACPTN